MKTTKTSILFKILFIIGLTFLLSLIGGKKVEAVNLSGTYIVNKNEKNPFYVAEHKIDAAETLPATITIKFKFPNRSRVSFKM